MSAIRTQKSLIEMELRTGSFYGDENDTSRGSSWGKGPPKASSPAGEIDEEALAKMMEEASAEVSEAESVEPEEEPVVMASEPPASEPVAVVEPVKVSATPPLEDDFSEFLLGEELDGSSFAPKSKRIISKPQSPLSPAPQPVVAKPPDDTNSEDPDIKRFLDSDEYDEFFKDL